MTPLFLPAPSEQNYFYLMSWVWPSPLLAKLRPPLQLSKPLGQINGVANRPHSHSLPTQNGQGSSGDFLGLVTDGLAFSSLRAPLPAPTPQEAKAKLNTQPAGDQMCSLWSYLGLSVGTDAVPGSKHKNKEGNFGGELCRDDETAQLGTVALKAKPTGKPCFQPFAQWLVAFDG